MELKKIHIAESLALRMLDRIAELKQVHAEQGGNHIAAKGNPDFYQRYWSEDRVSSPKHTGALKRASMDLSRALSELRRP